MPLEDYDSLVCPNCGGNYISFTFSNIIVDGEIIGDNLIEFDWSTLKSDEPTFEVLLRCKDEGCLFERMVSFNWGSQENG